MGTPDDIKTLFKKMDALVDAQGNTNLELKELRGDLKVIVSEMGHKADCSEVSELRGVVERISSSHPMPGFWSGMSASQKTTVVTTTIAAIGSTVALVVQNIM